MAANCLHQQLHYDQFLSHIYDVNGRRQSIDKLLKGSDAPTKWSPALSNEWGRLAQGNDNGVECTNTINFVSYNEVPRDRKVTYASFVCNHRPLKSEEWRIRLVVGGDKLEYEFDSGSPTTDLTKTKILLNSTISDAKDGARFLTLDLKDIFLHTPMERPEYMKVPIRYFPADIIKKYNLDNLVHTNGYVYIKIIKLMYGLKQQPI